MVLNIFRRKKEKKKEEEQKTKEKKDLKEAKIIATCEVCKNPIYENDEYRTLNFHGQKIVLHKKCFRKMKKTAKQFLKSGTNLPF